MENPIEVDDLGVTPIPGNHRISSLAVWVSPAGTVHLSVGTRTRRRSERVRVEARAPPA